MMFVPAWFQLHQTQQLSIGLHSLLHIFKGDWTLNAFSQVPVQSDVQPPRVVTGMPGYTETTGSSVVPYATLW